jgi:hypothetical protein
MLARFRFNCQTTLITLTFALIALLPVPQDAFADSPQIPPANPWMAMEFSTQTSQVQILHDSQRPFERDRPTFVLTHGMGGTAAGDRFHQLADAICNAVPDSNVLIIDWSKQSWRTRGYFETPSPWDVAPNIDPVAMEAVELLKALQVDPARTTFIGESFGNCVNARIAETLGGRGRILAFNPPNDLAGYKTPDLRFCSDVAWSFQTYSLCDCQSPIADVGFFLETPADAMVKDQHVFGVAWLAARVQSGDLTWLFPELILPEPAIEDFDAIVTISGEILDIGLPRHLFVTETDSESSVPLMVLR